MNAVLSPPDLALKGTQTVGHSLPRVRQSFVVNLEHGLHARPCALLVKTLQPYNLRVEVEANGETASGKSILGLMSLAAGPGASITFTITGEDAFRAMAQVDRLFSTNFEVAFRPARSQKT